MFFLGVDGGGTKTEFLIINQKGKVVGHDRKGTCHYRQTSFENFKEVIESGVKEVCAKANIDISDLSYSLLGLPGYGAIQEHVLEMDRILKDIFKTNKYKAVNDAVVGWAGSLGCEPGINIVAGTGAIGYGVNRDGQYERAGGWGHHCGDEGSAYWIGKKVLELFTKQSDGRMEKTLLYDIVQSELKLKYDFDLLNIMIDEYKMDRTKIANLSLIMHKAAEGGDLSAKKVFSQAAYEHYLIIKTLVKKLDFSGEDRLPVSYSGGVFNSGKYVLEPLRSYISELDKRIELVQPLLEPISGAVLYAYKVINGDNYREIIKEIRLWEDLVALV